MTKLSFLLLTLLALALGSLACDEPEPEEELPEETATSAAPSDEVTDEATPTATLAETAEPTHTDEPTASRTPAPEPVASAGADAAGSTDFRDVGRFPNSYIERWQSHGEVLDCEGEGPVAAYERWEIHYRTPEEHIRPARDILNHLLVGLLQRGWLVNRSDGFSLMMYRGADPGTMHYSECNPGGETHWVYIGVNSDTSGLYVVQVVMPQGSSPY